MCVAGLSEAMLQPGSWSLGDKGTHYIKTIKNSSNHLATLINDILDAAAMAKGKLVIKQENVRHEWQNHLSCNVLRESCLSVRLLLVISTFVSLPKTAAPQLKSSKAGEARELEPVPSTSLPHAIASAAAVFKAAACLLEHNSDQEQTCSYSEHDLVDRVLHRHSGSEIASLACLCTNIVVAELCH